jgi:hypothetical protein
MVQADLPPGVAAWSERVEAIAWADIVRGLSEQAGNPLGARLGQSGELQLPMVAALDFEPFNRTVGLGIAAPAEARQVDEIVAFYEAGGVSNFAISVSPYARPPELPGWLAARGLARGATSAKAWRDVEAPPEIHTDLRIEVIGPSDAEAWARVERAAWGMVAAMTRWFTSSVGRPGWLHLLGYDDEIPVTAAALFVSGDVGWLGFGATIPTHRRRGGHGALVARRIREAAALGCSFLITETGADTPGAPNPSYDNLVKAGFRLAYPRANYTPQPAAGGPAGG